MASFMLLLGVILKQRREQVHGSIDRVLTKWQSTEIATAIATVPIQRLLQRMVGNYLPRSTAVVEWLSFPSVNVVARMRRFSGFNSLDTLQPLRN